MKKCYILHIPTGSYLKDIDGNNSTFISVSQAITHIKLIMVWQKVYKQLFWNRYNKPIGLVLSKNEFEIIRIGE